MMALDLPSKTPVSITTLGFANRTAIYRNSLHGGHFTWRLRFCNIISFSDEKKCASLRNSMRQASADDGEASGNRNIMSSAAEELGGAVNDVGREGKREATLYASAKEKFASLLRMVDAR